MPTKSRARREVERLLDEATTPEQRAEYATKLARIVHQEGMERARKRRAAKPKAAPKKGVGQPLTEEELNEVVEFEYTPPAVLTPQPRVERLTAEQIAELNTIHQPPPTEPEPEIDLANDDLPPNAWRPDGTGGWTRTVSAANSPGAMFYDYARGGYFEDVDPRSSVGVNDWYPASGAATSHVYHADTGEFDFERKERQQREEEAQYANYSAKLFGR